MKEILSYLAKRNGEEQDIFVLEEMAELQKELENPSELSEEELANPLE